MNLDNKTILITGATGLIGSNLVNRIMQYNNVQVIVLGRNENKIKKYFRKYLNKNNFNYIVQDIKQQIFIDKFVDVIFHAAGPMEGYIISNFPVDVILPNIYGITNCLEFLRKQNEKVGKMGRIVVFSSVTIYGNVFNEDIIVNENDTKISDSLDSTNACYSQSKRMVEVIAKSYAKQYKIDVVIARLSTVYGKTMILPKTAFYDFIRNVIYGEDIVINTSGAAKRDNIYIDDAIEGLLCICDSGISGEVYNVSSNGDGGNYAAIDEIANYVLENYNKISPKSSRSIVKFRNNIKSKRAPGIKLDNCKLKKLDWNIKYTLNDGIYNTIKTILEGNVIL